MPTLARDTDNSFAPTKLPSGHTGTISTTARCGAAWHVASVPLRRGETSVQSQRKKSPLEEKHLPFSPSRYILSYRRPYPPLSLPSSTSAGLLFLYLCRFLLVVFRDPLWPLSSCSCSFCLGSSFSEPSAILFLSVPWQGRTMQRDPGARIRGE